MHADHQPETALMGATISPTIWRQYARVKSATSTGNGRIEETLEFFIPGKGSVDWYSSNNPKAQAFRVCIAEGGVISTDIETVRGEFTFNSIATVRRVQIHGKPAGGLKTKAQVLADNGVDLEEIEAALTQAFPDIGKLTTKPKPAPEKTGRAIDLDTENL